RSSSGTTDPSGCTTASASSALATVGRRQGSIRNLPCLRLALLLPPIHEGKKGCLCLVRLQPIAKAGSLLLNARENGLARMAHQLTCKPHRLRRLGRYRLRGGDDALFERFGRHDVVDQPCGLRPLGGKALAQCKKRKGPLVAEHGRAEQARRRLRHEAEVGKRRVEDSFRRGEGQ